jgi:hypothetical protein
METVWFSETLASIDESKWHQNPEEQHHEANGNSTQKSVLETYDTPTNVQNL